MDEHFIFILQANRLAMFEEVRKAKFESFKYKGEVFFEYETKDLDYEKISETITEYIKDELNEDDFSKISFTIINNDCDLKLISEFSRQLIPCKKFAVREFEDILPELLLKLGKIKLKEKLPVQFEGRNYLVTMDEKGNSSIQDIKTRDEKSYILKINDIPNVLIADYRFITDKDEIDKLTADLKVKDAKTTILLSKMKKNENENKIILEGYEREINSLNNDLQKEKKNISFLNNFIKKQIEFDFGEAIILTDLNRINIFLTKYKEFKGEYEKYHNRLVERKDYLEIKQNTKISINLKKEKIKNFFKKHPSSKYSKELKKEVE